MNYSLRELNSGDIKEIDALFSIVFQHFFKKPSKSNLELINWKHFNNPNGKSVLMGAFFDKELIASAAMIPEKINYFGEEKISYKCTDLMTHPDHHRKSLSKQIISLLLKESKVKSSFFCYTLCSKLATKSFVKNNWKHLDNIVYYFKPNFLIRLSSFFSSKFDEGLEFVDSLDLLKTYKFENRTTDISVHKSYEFLQWRILHPNFPYRIIVHRNSDGEVNGYLIYSLSTNKILNVIDVDSVGKTNIKIKLIKAAETIVYKEKLRAILVTCSHKSSFGNFFRTSGYFVNTYSKGPLKSFQDLNIFYHAHLASNFSTIDSWNFYGLSYDDV